jgi:hypothetical protein
VWDAFGNQTYKDVNALTKDGGFAALRDDDDEDEYDWYIRRLLKEGSYRAQMVKLADLLHNTDPARGSQTIERTNRYAKALQKVVSERTAGRWCAADVR